MWHQNGFSLCPGSGIFQMYSVNKPFTHVFSFRKYKLIYQCSFLQIFRVFLYHSVFIIAIKLDFLTHLIWVWTLLKRNHSPFRLGFQHLSPAKFNVWKIMFDPCISFLELVMCNLHLTDFNNFVLPSVTVHNGPKIHGLGSVRKHVLLNVKKKKTRKIVFQFWECMLFFVWKQKFS